MRAEERLREIEPLVAEAEELRRLLATMSEHDGQRHTSTAATSTRNRRGDVRTHRGGNKQLILKLAGQRPGITATDIADQTPMTREVASSTISRLKRQGVLENHPRGGVQLAANER